MTDTNPHQPTSQPPSGSSEPIDEQAHHRNSDLERPGGTEGLGASGDSGGGSVRKLEMVKDGHRYVFRYRMGEEAIVLSNLMDMARDPGCPLNMFDAAVLSHQMGQSIGSWIEKKLIGVEPTPST